MGTLTVSCLRHTFKPNHFKMVSADSASFAFLRPGSNAVLHISRIEC